jgi:hypothetical protein
VPSTSWNATGAAPWIAPAAALAERLVDPSGDQAMAPTCPGGITAMAIPIRTVISGTVIIGTVISPPFAWS